MSPYVYSSNLLQACKQNSLIQASKLNTSFWLPHCVIIVYDMMLTSQSGLVAECPYVIFLPLEENGCPHVIFLKLE